MKRREFGFSLLSVLVGSRSLLACGDKYFVTVQGTRYPLASLSKDSNILIYKNPSSETSKLFSRIPVTDTLSRDGFLTRVVTKEDEFQTELKHPWTIIIAGSADAEKVPTDIAKKSVLLPVVDKKMTAQIKQIKDKYHYVLNATPPNGEAFLGAVYDALVHRPKLS